MYIPNNTFLGKCTMRKSIAKPVKDFADIMNTVDFSQVDKKVKEDSKLSKKEIQKHVDFYVAEIECNKDIISNSSSEKEIVFHQEKLKLAETKLEYYKNL